MTVGERCMEAINVLYEDTPNIVIACTEETGISQSTMSRFTNGEIDKMTPSVGKLIKSTGVSQEWLMTGKGNMFGKDGSMTQTGNNSNQQRSGRDSFSGEPKRVLPADIELVVDEMSKMEPEERKVVRKIVEELAEMDLVATTKVLKSF